MSNVKTLYPCHQERCINFKEYAIDQTEVAKGNHLLALSCGNIHICQHCIYFEKFDLFTERNNEPS